jgi:pyruvate/2-oxoacid:ferredoxin oxidoreductase beta subunit
MQVLCMASNNEEASVACPSCGQTYAIYYSRQTSDCEAALAAVRSALVEHHATDASASAHPAHAFNVPAWSGPAHMSAAALLSGAPVRRVFESQPAERLIS